MSDPLSITSSILTVIGAAKQLYDFVERIKGAPDVLEKSKSDLLLTVKTLKALYKYVDGRPQESLMQETVLRPVLDRCTQTCEALQTLLNSLVRHSDHVSFWDRTRLARSEDDIEERRKDISYARESVTIVVGSLTLITSSNSQDAINAFKDKASTTMGDISEDIRGIDTAIKVLGSRMDELSKKNLEDRKSALADFQKLCEASVTAVQKEARYKSVFGDMKTSESAKVFAGVATKELGGGVDQKFGDSDIGSQGVVFMGAGDTEAMLGFFRQAENQHGMHGANVWREATSASNHQPGMWQVPILESHSRSMMDSPFGYSRNSEWREFVEVRGEEDGNSAYGRTNSTCRYSRE